MIIGIHPDPYDDVSFWPRLIEFARQKGAEVKSLNLLASDALEQAKQCDGIMWRWGHNEQDKQSAQRILYTIEHYLKIPVFPNSSTTWHYDEKIAQVYLLDALQAPVPQCWLFWDYEEALHWAKTAPYPVVFKLSVGASSSHVLKVTNEQEAVQLINSMFKRGVFPMTMNEYQPKQGLHHSLSQVKTLAKRGIKALDYLWTGDYPALHPMWWKPEYGYAYFQEFLPNNAFDTRVTVIGDRAFAYRRMNRPNDFRASGSGNFDVNPELINQECVKIAFQVSERGDFQSMAYDFLTKNDRSVICEISYTYVAWMVHSCPGHWDKNLNWHEGQMWPEDAIVEDFLEYISK